jgi:Autographiviridae endonuclease VII
MKLKVRLCNRCKHKLPETQFHKKLSKRASYCKKCVSERNCELIQARKDRELKLRQDPSIKKICVTCKQELFLSEFWLIDSHCKKCALKIGSIYRQNRILPCLPDDFEKRCNLCKRLLPKIAFSMSRTNSDGLQYRCKLCTRAGRFGLTANDINSIIDAQDGKCIICFVQFNQQHKYCAEWPCIDHNHTTNEVRGVICSQCNKGIGCFKESTEVMSRAIGYLQLSV